MQPLGLWRSPAYLAIRSVFFVSQIWNLGASPVLAVSLALLNLKKTLDALTRSLVGILLDFGRAHLGSRLRSVVREHNPDIWHGGKQYIE